jgi:hypothetical protein
MNGLRNKLTCLPEPVKETDNRKDTSLLQNTSISRKLRVPNAL